VGEERLQLGVSIRGPGERWVYARYYEEEPVHEQLFDLDSDPLQLTNLAGDPAFAEELASQRARCDLLLER
jgi:arylsulfatase A-like enzyme